MASTEQAAQGLFALLREYQWQKLNAIAGMANSSAVQDHQRHQEAYSGVDVAREVIAGSILQIAYSAIEAYGTKGGMSPGALHFESEMNRLIGEIPNARAEKLSLPQKFCVGRHLGDLPIGLVIYAARNQYNHFSAKRLSVVNEVVFNYLNAGESDRPDDFSFDLYDENQFYCYSSLAVLHWADTKERPAYHQYKKDMSEVLGIEF